MNKYIRCINYLISKKTQNIPHNNKSLFKHLVNVYDKLRSWKCNEDICFAGLFHSIYGNNIFTTEVEKDRDIIKKLIGDTSENLVYLYNKDRFQNKDLKIISLANELEHSYINIIDNYFDKNEILENYFYFRDNAPWNFTGSGKDETKWRKFKYDLKFNNKIEKKFKKCTQNILKNLGFFDLLKLERVYASANPYGTVHESHKDNPFIPIGGITVMYYLNSFWDLNFAGETVFIDNGEIIKSIIPKPGRVIVFDGNIEHCAREVRRDVNDLRMVLTFKYHIKI
jgi:SM-20-related protein